MAASPCEIKLQREYDQLQKEIRISDERLEDLKNDMLIVEKEYEEALENNLTAPQRRLEDKMAKLMGEKEHEVCVNEHIRRALQQRSYELTKVKLEHEKAEARNPRGQGKTAESNRINEEISKCTVMEQKIKPLLRKIETDNEDHVDYKETIKAEIINLQKRHKPFAEEAVARLKEDKMNKRNERIKKYEHALKSVTVLKDAIERSKDSLGARRAEWLAEKQAIIREENELRRKAIQRHEDDEKELALHKKMAEIEAHRKAFSEAQQRRRLEIVAKILETEERQARKIKKMPSLFEKDRFQRLDVSKKPDATCVLQEDMLMNNNLREPSEQTEKTVRQTVDPRVHSLVSSSRSSSGTESAKGVEKQTIKGNMRSAGAGKSKVLNSVPLEDVDSALDNFISRDYGQEYRYSKGGADGRSTAESSEEESADTDEEKSQEAKKIQKLQMHQASKLEKEILARTLRKTRENIVQPQRVGKREFSGPGFTCNPKEIWFKDFTVNEEHKLKVVLTNSSFKAIPCRFIDMTRSLLDFVQIQFSPTGPLSPGIGCPLDVTFVPKLERDLQGELNFLAPTGPFNIPFRATIKRSEPSVNMDCVDFGDVVIGETVTKIVVLRNSGARAVNFTFGRLRKVYGKAPEETSVDKIELKDATEATVVTGDSSGYKKEDDLAKDTEIIKKEVKPDEDEDLQQPEEPHVNMKEEEITASLDWQPEFCCTGTTQGTLAPFSSINLSVSWSPKVVLEDEGDNSSTTDEFVVEFDDPNCSSIRVHVRGCPKDLPTCLSTDTMVMGICWYDRLYQDCFAVNNRTTTALKVTFKFSDRIGNHMDILPRTGYVQAKSRLLAQVKFMPKKTLAADVAVADNQAREGDEMENEVGDSLAPSFDTTTGVLHVPIAVCVAGQTNILDLVMAAVVTTSDMTLSPDPVEFGTVELSETAIAKIRLTNHSLLSQDFGIVGVPEYVQVQPNDGFGTIPPKQTFELELLFTPQKPKDYTFNVHCKSGIGRIFTVSCSGIGVLSPLKISAHKISLAPTPVGEYSVGEFVVSNVHISANQFTHPQPRIGSFGPMAPVGPKAYEFTVVDSAYSLPPCAEEDAQMTVDDVSSFLTVYPQANTLNPGESQRVMVFFKPLMNHQAIRQHAARAMDTERQHMLDESHPAETTEGKSGRAAKGKKQSGSEKKKEPPKKDKTSAKDSETSVRASTDEAFIPTNPEYIEEDSDTYCSALGMFLRSFPLPPARFDPGDINKNRLTGNLTPTVDSEKMDGIPRWPGSCVVYRLACFIANGPGSERAANPPPTYSLANTQFIELTCPIVRPALQILSNRGQNTLNFGALCGGQRKSQTITFKNISPYPLELTTSPLNPLGPFEIVNTLRKLGIDEIGALCLTYCPTKSGVYSELLQIEATPSTTHSHKKNVKKDQVWQYPLTIKMMGTCIIPEVHLSGPPELSTLLCGNTSAGYVGQYAQHELCFGSVMAGEFKEVQLEISNPTTVPVQFKILPDELKTRGTQNSNGSPVFLFVPNSGMIQPGQTNEVIVNFAPNQPSDFYHESFVLKLQDQFINSHTLALRGYGRASQMYVRGDDYTSPTDKQMNATQNDYLGLPFSGTGDEQAVQTVSYLMIHASRASISSSALESERERKTSKDAQVSTVRTLKVGCTQSVLNIGKKNGEYVVDNSNELAALGFTVTPAKNTVEPGTEQDITFTWTPNPEVRIGSIINTSARITLKADVNTTHLVHLRGIA